MKKTLMICFGLATLLMAASVFLPVQAETVRRGVSLSADSLTIEVGETKTFDIVAFDTIADVEISSNNTGVAQVDRSIWSTGLVGDNETKTDTITVTGVRAGQATITAMLVDAVIFNTEEDLSGQRRTVNILVTDSTNGDSGNTPGDNHHGNGTSGTRPSGSNNNSVPDSGNNVPVDNGNHNQGSVNNNQVSDNNANANRPVAPAQPAAEGDRPTEDDGQENDGLADPTSDATTTHPSGSNSGNSNADDNSETETKPIKSSNPPFILMIVIGVAVVAVVGGAVYFYQKRR